MNEVNIEYPFYISYFYKLRFLPPDIIPISTAISDPSWFKPKFDKRGVLYGINLPEFHHPKAYGCGCPCINKNPEQCEFLKTYREHLRTLNKNEEMEKFKSIAESLKSSNIPVRGFCLLVYETPDNPCSERKPLQELWQSWGLNLPEYKENL